MELKTYQSGRKIYRRGSIRIFQENYFQLASFGISIWFFHFDFKYFNEWTPRHLHGQVWLDEKMWMLWQSLHFTYRNSRFDASVCCGRCINLFFRFRTINSIGVFSHCSFQSKLGTIDFLSFKNAKENETEPTISHKMSQSMRRCNSHTIFGLLN